MVAAYPLPITPHDAVTFDMEIFEEYRGRGYYGLLANYRLGKLKLMGVNRVFGSVYGWNNSIIHGIEKTYYRKFGKVRIFHLFGRNITIWSIS